jgi:hypothetical protein
VLAEPDYVAARLPIIAYEDVGVADLTCLLWTKQAAATIPVQTQTERRKIATAIAGRLADALKSRTACDILCLTNCSPEATQYADDLVRLGLTDWIDAATTSTQPLIKRAVAWRFILGLAAGGRRPNIAVAGSRNAVLATVAEAMQLPMGLVAAIQAGTGTHNLHAALALAHELLYSTSEVRIKHGNSSPIAGRVAGGLMLCALDMYTRAGRTAYRRVLSSAPRLVAMLRRYAPHGDPVECVGMLMFHAEGSLLSRGVESPASAEVQVEVEQAEAMSAGFENPEGALKVRQWLRHHQQAGRRRKNAGHRHCSNHVVGIMNAPTTKLTFNRRPWWVPSEGRAFEGWLEGRPTAAQREDAVARARQQRANWKPNAQAWDQLIQLQTLVGRRVRIQFWDPLTMHTLAEDEWPHAVEGNCEGVATLIDDGYLQAFLVLRDPVEAKTGGSSGLAYLVERATINCKLAPVAEIYEVEAVLGSP